MKKLLVLAGISVLLFLGSCATSKVPIAKVVFDDSVPLEKSSWIWLTGTITAYNGISVSGWETEFCEMIQIPAGEALIEFDLYLKSGYHNAFSNGFVTFKAKNMIFRYNFQAQKQYLIRFRDPSDDYGRIKDEEYGVDIYAWNFGEKIPAVQELREANPNYLGFVPFLVQPVFAK